MTTARDLAAAQDRVQAVLERRPEVGRQDDAPATARWQGGTRVVAHHANGTAVATDMPAEIGGSGDQVTPGWLFRAGLASCAATSIAMLAAREDIALATLELRAESRSDARGLFGLRDDAGQAIAAMPEVLRLHVRIGAAGVTPERLRSLVERALACSPIPQLAARALPLALQVEAG